MAPTVRDLIQSILLLAVCVSHCVGGSNQVDVRKRSPFAVGIEKALKTPRWPRLNPTATHLPGEAPELSETVNDQTSIGILKGWNAVVRYKDTENAAETVSPRPVHDWFKPRGGAAALANLRPLLFWESMVCGAVSRSVAQTVMHPANTMKTILQSTRGADRPTLRTLMQVSMFKTLTRGAGANLVLSIPHGAVNFAVLEFVRSKLNDLVNSVPYLAERVDSIGPALDFSSSAISTVCCSVVSTPQMMITDNIMAGNFPRLPEAVRGLYTENGVLGFYSGWWPGLVGKIPSYALTWTIFQQLKRVRAAVSDKPIRNIENTIMGCIASTTTVCIMIPVDTIKVRLITQLSATASSSVPYKGIVDCAVRIAREEGMSTFYRGLAPRLISVVPMIGIQFGVYEAMKKVMLARDRDRAKRLMKGIGRDQYGSEEALEEATMEVAASANSPFPAPHFLKAELRRRELRKKKQLEKQL